MINIQQPKYRYCRTQSLQILDLHQISYFKHQNLSKKGRRLVSQIQLNFIFADKSVFSPLCSQLFSQDLSRSCNILPLVNITRPCNPAIIQPLTRHSQDLNIIVRACFLSSDWSELSPSVLWWAGDDGWWHPWHVTIVSSSPLHLMIRRSSHVQSQSQTMNTAEEDRALEHIKCGVIREQRRCLDKWPIKATLKM